MKVNKEVLEAILSLTKLTNDDKLLVIKKLIPKEILIKWAALCAESVLHIFESKRPEDKRVKDCIEYLLSDNNTNREMLLKHRDAADAAGFAAADYSAHYAAAAASHAADAAVHATAHYAADAGDAYASYVHAAANVTAYAAASIEDQWVNNYNILVSLVEG